MVACMDGADYITRLRVVNSELRRHDGKELPKAGERHPIMQQFVAACEILGLPINVGKKVVQDFNGAILGGELDGVRGSLGVAPDKGHKFVGKTCALLSVPKATQVACQHWSGLYCFAAGFRRPLFSVLEEIFSFIEHELWTGECLLAVFNAGEARFEAYLDDYAWLLNALLASLQARWSRTRLEFAIRLADALLLRFEDTVNGGFHFSDSTIEVPITRSMIFQDDATPSGNAIAIGALNRLARLLGKVRYSEAAERCLARSMTQLRESPTNMN